MRAAPLVLAALAACTPAHSPQTPHTKAAADLESKTVALVATTWLGDVKAYCSGVWVGENTFLTANHCVADEDIGDRVSYVTRGDVSAADGDELEAVRWGRVADKDLEHDLAKIVVLLPPEHATARFGTEPAVGDAVQTMGHPRGLWWSYSAGNVAALRILDDGIWMIQSTAPISPGCSGGGLFDVNGDLVGIAHSYIPTNAENLNLYIDGRYAKLFVSAQ